MKGNPFQHRRKAAAAIFLLLLPVLIPLTTSIPAAAARPTPLYTNDPPSAPLFVNVSAKAGVSANDSILAPNLAAAERGANFLNGGRGACVLDYDEDNDDDIYVVGPGKNQLFRNDGLWIFADVTDSAGVGDVGYGMGCASGDLDNDGYQDIIVTNYREPLIIYRNNRNGTFSNVTTGSNVDSNGPQTGIAIADFDGDSLLDFFVTRWGKNTDSVYRNLGGFTFEDESSDAGIIDYDFGFQPIAADFDGDGDQDVYVVNDFGRDTLWVNSGSFTFSDKSIASGADDPRGGMGGAWGDYNNDGRLDISVTNFEPDGLYEYNGTRFNDVGNASGVDDDWTGWGTVWIDYDNDGWLDLAVANGNVEIGREWLQPNKLFHNLGNETFADVSTGSGAESGEVSRGLATGDFNGDGMLDMYVVNVNCPAELLANNVSNTNGWLGVKLEGRVSNRDGVGATITLPGGTRQQTRLVSAGSSYLSSNSKVAHFGLGNATLVTDVTVEWPSGLTQRLFNVAANQTITIVETDAENPVAIAPDIVADQGLPFVLNGSMSRDNVRVSEWLWTVVGNGTTMNASGVRTTMTIYSPGDYLGTLTLHDLLNRTVSVAFNITVRPLAAVWVEAGPDIAVPEGTTVAFNVTGRSTDTPDFEGACSFTWSFAEQGTPVTLTGPRPSYTFLRPGFYTVNLTVVDPKNVRGFDSVNVTVTDGTRPVIVAVAPSAVDEDTDVVLDASGSTDNDPNFASTSSFEWSYPGYSGTVVWRGARVTARFADPGTFALKLTVRDAASNAAIRNFTVAVRDTTPPLANTGMDGAAVLPGQEVLLLGIASEDNDQRFPNQGVFVWTITGPEGSTNYTGIRQVVTFAYPGDFQVALMVWDPSGNPSPAPSTMIIHVIDTVAPVPDGGGGRTVGVGDLVNFDASGTTDNDPTILETGAFVWEFQDGAQRFRLEGLTQTHVFLLAGIYTVRLTVADAGDNRAAELFKVTVVDDVAPQIRAQPIPSQVESGTNVVMNASATTDNVGVASIGWRVKGPFGYDQFVTGAEGSLQLAMLGEYNLTVTAQDAAGNTDTASFLVRVVPRPSGGNSTGGSPNGTDPGSPGTGTGNGSGPVTPGTGNPAPSLGVLPAAASLLSAAAIVGWVHLWRRRR